MKHQNKKFRPVEVHDFTRGNSHHPAVCRTANGIEYGPVQEQEVHETVSFADAWAEALANHGRVDRLHIPTVQEKINAHNRVVREVWEEKRKSALSLPGVE